MILLFRLDYFFFFLIDDTIFSFFFYNKKFYVSFNEIREDEIMSDLDEMLYKT
jgi:hypothetical protein